MDGGNSDAGTGLGSGGVEDSPGETEEGSGDSQTGAGDTTDPDGGKDTTEEPTDPQGGDDEDDKPVVDPAFEESKQTCIATCGLKCKSESSDKKDACIDLCFN